MSSSIAGTRFRHVVFADPLNFRRSRPVDFSPGTGRGAGDAPDEHESLGSEEHTFLRWLLDQAGVDVAHYRPETLARRVPACLRELRAASVSHARASIERNRALLEPALGAVLIGATGFFRDAVVFGALRERVLPRLTERPGARIWSAACADGQELYSVAMLLAEAGALPRCHLLGTDCRAAAVAAAAEGRFAATAMRAVPEVLARRYFERPDSAGGACVVRAALRAAVQWRAADVLRVREPGLWDLILCRNLAIYMRPEVVLQLWILLAEALRPGGYLVLGKAERPTPGLGLEPVEACVFRRVRA